MKEMKSAEVRRLRAYAHDVSVQQTLKNTADLLALNKILETTCRQKEAEQNQQNGSEKPGQEHDDS